jgi:hypothetical protein
MSTARRSSTKGSGGGSMGAVCRFGEPGPDDGRASGPAADHSSYGSFAPFSDPDGNGWLLQEVTTRLPGRVDPGATSFGSASDLASALRRAAAAARGEHEKRPREASTRSEHEKRAREAPRREGRELARVVRGVHGGRARRRGAAVLSALAAPRHDRRRCACGAISTCTMLVSEPLKRAHRPPLLAGRVLGPS